MEEVYNISKFLEDLFFALLVKRKIFLLRGDISVHCAIKIFQFFNVLLN